MAADDQAAASHVFVHDLDCGVVSCAAGRAAGHDDGVTYPPEPWNLQGQMHACAFRVPLAELPLDLAHDLPPGCRPVSLGGHGIVGTAWVFYEPGGVLSYREVMATLLVRRGRRVMPTILAIWVDSETSRDGGRALWGIPKQLAAFEFGPQRLTAKNDSGDIATGTVRPRLRLPGRWPVAFSVVQWLEGAAKISPVRSKAVISLDTARLDANPDGPLGFLAGRKPFVSLSLRDFRMTFGRHSRGRSNPSPIW